MNSLEKYYENPERYENEEMPNFEVFASLKKNDIFFFLYWSGDCDSSTGKIEHFIETGWKVEKGSFESTVGAIAIGANVLRLSRWTIEGIEELYQEKHVKIYGKPDPDYPPVAGGSINGGYY